MDITYTDEILIFRNTIIREHKNKNRKSKLLTMIKELREKEKNILLDKNIYINREIYTIKVGNISHTI